MSVKGPDGFFLLNEIAAWNIIRATSFGGYPKFPVPIAGTAIDFIPERLADLKISFRAPMNFYGIIN